MDLVKQYNKSNNIKENTMSDEDKSLIELAIDEKAEDFKQAVFDGLNNRLRSSVDDARSTYAEEAMGHIEKPEGKKSNVPAAVDPKATNPGAKGHEQTDEKKSGKKKAAEPKAKG